MAGKFVDKVLGLIGFDGRDIDDYEEYEDEREEQSYEEFPPKPSRKVLSIHSQRQVKLIVTKPKSFDDVQEIAANLKSNRPVVMNLADIERDIAKRVLDFTSGCVYALEGSMQKIGDGVFLLTPRNFEITGDLPERDEDSLLSWE